MSQPKYKAKFFGKILLYPLVIMAAIFLYELICNRILHRESNEKEKWIIALSVFLLLETWYDIVNFFENIKDKYKNYIFKKKLKFLNTKIELHFKNISSLEESRVTLATHLENKLKTKCISEEAKCVMVDDFVNWTEKHDIALGLEKSMLEILKAERTILFNNHGIFAMNGENRNERTYSYHNVSHITSIIRRQEEMREEMHSVNNFHDALEDANFGRYFFTGIDSAIPGQGVKRLEIDNQLIEHIERISRTLNMIDTIHPGTATISDFIDDNNDDQI